MKKFGTPVFQGTVEQMSKIRNEGGYSSVDVITMDDVSEHLTHPDMDFRALFDILPPGGILITRQMNVASLGHRLYGRNWYYLQPAAHMNYFSPRTLGQLLSQIGFQMVSVDEPHTLPLIFRTLYVPFRKRLRSFLWKIRATPFKGPKKVDNKTATKPLYLVKRKKTSGDLFTMVCRKPD